MGERADFPAELRESQPLRLHRAEHRPARDELERIRLTLGAEPPARHRRTLRRSKLDGQFVRLKTVLKGVHGALAAVLERHGASKCTSRQMHWTLP